MRLNSSLDSMTLRDVRCLVLAVIHVAEPFGIGVSAVESSMHLGKADEADDQGDEGDAAQQIHIAEIIPDRAGDDIDADGGHQDAQAGA